MDAQKKNKEGKKAVMFLESLKSPVLEKAEIAKFNAIVRNEAKQRFLPKKAKRMLTKIYDAANAETKKKLMKL